MAHSSAAIGVTAAIAPGRPRGRVVAIAFLGLRAMSAFGAMANGFALTFSFARVLDTHLFALFMFIGNLGVTVWLFDLGLARVLYVRLRELHLSGTLAGSKDTGRQAASVVLLYSALVLTGAAVIFAVRGRLDQGVPLAMFFAFCAMNVPWYVFRQLSAATDCFVAFEMLEALRRVVHITLIIALPFGLGLNLCLALGNAMWIVVFGSSLLLLIRAGGLVLGTPSALVRAFCTFLRQSRRDLAWSAGYVGSELFSYSYPPLLIPLVYGLGPAAIAFDTAYKVFRGANLLHAAACEVAVPWQTRAHAAQDRRGMIRATAAAALLAAVPALGVCALLILAGDMMFGRLLGASAIVPHALSVLIAVLVAANWLQTVANFTLVYTGFFSAIARLALTMAALLSLAGIYNVVARPGLIGFTACYMAIYIVGAVAHLILALRLPLAPGGGRPIRVTARVTG